MYRISTANGIRVEDIESGADLARRVVELSGQPRVGLTTLQAAANDEEVRLGCRPGSEGFKKFGQTGFIVSKVKRRAKPQPRKGLLEYTADHVRGAPQLIWPDCPPPPQKPGEPDYEFHDPEGEFCQRVMAGLMYQLYPPRTIGEELYLPMVN